MSQTTEPLKAAVTVAEMARTVGLSPQRFQQLKKEGVFPWPLYSLATRRPIYTEEQQAVCLEVRRRNCGINGQPVLFYARRAGLPTVAPRRHQARPGAQGRPQRHAELIEALAALGQTVTDAQADSAIRSVFPTGVRDMDEGEVIRAVFRHLRRQNSADNVGR